MKNRRGLVSCIVALKRKSLRLTLFFSSGKHVREMTIVYFTLYNKDIQIPSKHNKIYYILPLLDYMFRLLRVIIRPSSELIQNYLTISSLEGLMMTLRSRNM